MEFPEKGGASSRNDSPAGDFVREFVSRNGRPPRILHIGNVANNAYKNALFLNRAGLDCDVLCNDYYHLMGCPEWEDALVLKGTIENQAYPKWYRHDMGGFQRPRWFVQGPLDLCVQYLIARRNGRKGRARTLWRRLSGINQTARTANPVSLLERQHIEGTLAGKLYFYSRLIASRGPRKAARTGLGFLGKSPMDLKTRFLAGQNPETGLFFQRQASRAKGRMDDYLLGPHTEEVREFLFRIPGLVKTFAREFPERPDRLTPGDLLIYQSVVGLWTRLFRHYDLIQGYAVAPIYPLLTGKKPYVAFEHGTLRDFTLDPDPLCRSTSLAYNQADHTFITNGDCLEYAQKIGVTRYDSMPHPIDEKRIRAVKGDYEALHKAHGARYLFLCPLRHDWKVKGTDKYIRALPGMVGALGPDIKIIMTNWGAELDKSRELARELGVLDRIVWAEPLCRQELVRTIRSVDAVFDQIALPHFGATAPEAIALEVPVIASYNPESTRFIIPVPAPILSAWDEGEVVRRVVQAVDPKWREQYRIEARDWFDRFHSSDAVVEKHLKVYSRLLMDKTA